MIDRCAQRPLSQHDIISGQTPIWEPQKKKAATRKRLFFLAQPRKKTWSKSGLPFFGFSFFLNFGVSAQKKSFFLCTCHNPKKTTNCVKASRNVESVACSALQQNKVKSHSRQIFQRLTTMEKTRNCSIVLHKAISKKFLLSRSLYLRIVRITLS